MDGAPEEKAVGAARCRRPWTLTEKLELVRKTYEPGISVGRVARGNGVDHKLLRRWRRLVNRGALGEAGAERRCVVCTAPFELNRVRFEIDSFCGLGWAARVPIWSPLTGGDRVRVTS